MKKTILIVLLLLSAGQVQGQVLISLLLGDTLNSGSIEFGLEGGVNWSEISGLETNSSLRTFNLGFYFDIKLEEQWRLYTGVLVKSNLGADELTTGDLLFLGTDTYPDNGTYAQEMKYFLVPALLKYNFENKFYIEAGPQFGLMYSARVEFNSDIDNKEARIREDNKDSINRFDTGLLFGAGYKLKKNHGMTIGIKYYYGLLDVYKNRGDTKNRSLFLKVTVPIGAGGKDAS